MSEHSDDAFDAALREEDRRFYINRGLRQQCEKLECTPRVFINDDALYECAICGKVTDV